MPCGLADATPNNSVPQPRPPPLPPPPQALLRSSGAALVIHTAGPFQRSSNYAVLEAALDTRTPYIDVCDDTAYSERYVQRYGRGRLCLTT